MADFIQLADNAFLGFGALILAMILLAIANYRYHFKGSKSVYLMRRLPDPREYARRCWTLPLIGVGICLVLTAVTTAVCYLIYMKCTPASCLVPGQWMRFWSALIGR